MDDYDWGASTILLHSKKEEHQKEEPKKEEPKKDDTQSTVHYESDYAAKESTIHYESDYASPTH